MKRLAVASLFTPVLSLTLAISGCSSGDKGAPGGGENDACTDCTGTDAGSDAGGGDSGVGDDGLGDRGGSDTGGGDIGGNVVCGDGTCVPGENCATCPADCACKGGQTCDSTGTCVGECHPGCGERRCGMDPICGTLSCGTCNPPLSECDSTGQCVAKCTPNCGARRCGMDPICGTQSCGTCSGAAPDCNAAGQCVVKCTPDCLSHVCGLDPICRTKSCGTCEANAQCNAFGQCGQCYSSSCGSRQCGFDFICDAHDYPCGTGCAAGETCDTNATCQPNALTVFPATASALIGRQIQFQASETVTWRAVDGGAIAPSGMYTVPDKAGTYHVEATSTVDGSRKVQAVVTARDPVIQTVVGPSKITMQGGDTCFLAHVTDSSDQRVTWSVVEANGGTIDAATGCYFPPASPGTYHVRATSVLDSSKAGDAAVLVANGSIPLDMAFPFGLVVVAPGQSVTLFGKPVIDSAQQLQITAAVMEGPSGGTVDPVVWTEFALNYTAPASPGVYHVAVTSKTDPRVVVASTIVVTESTGVTRLRSHLVYPMVDHHMVKLSDGRVAILGGDIKIVDAVPDAIQIFDPINNAIVPSGPMAEPRLNFAATVLNDGRILITGGTPDIHMSTAKQSAEIFDPATGRSRLVAPMAVARRWHAAVKLSDGRVFVAGGGSPTAEIFDPATETFSIQVDALPVTTDLPMEAGALTNGRAFAAYQPPGQNDLSEIYPFDSASGTFGSKISCDGGGAHVVPSKDGRFVLTGLNWPAMYDPAAGTCTRIQLGHLADASASGAVALSDGSIAFFGGLYSSNTGGGTTGMIARHDPDTGFTRFGELLFDSRMAMWSDSYFGSTDAMHLDDGRVLIAGGFHDPFTQSTEKDEGVLDTMEIWTPDNLAPATLPVTLTPNTVILETDPGFSSVDVAPDRLTFHFTRPPARMPVKGDVVVGSTGDGYLRKVVSVSTSGNDITLDTNPAVLTDAVKEGTLSVDLRPVTPLYGGITTPPLKIEKDLSGMTLVDHTVNGAHISLTIPTGTLNFSPGLNLRYDVTDSQAKRFEMTLTGNLEFAADVELAAGGLLADGGSVELPVASAPIRGSIGPLPVVGRVELAVALGYSAKAEALITTTVGGETTANLLARVLYENGAWTSEWDPGATAIGHPPVDDLRVGASASVSVKPLVRMVFYGVAGPWIDAEGTISFDGTISPCPRQWSLDAGIAAHLGVEVSTRILGGDLSFTKEMTLAAKTFPLGGDKPKPECLNVALPDCCSQQCVNLLDDDNHCGDCGTACKALETCMNGMCKCHDGSLPPCLCLDGSNPPCVGVFQVSAGPFHTCILASTKTAPGQAYCVGENGRGNLGDGTNNDSATLVPVVGLTDAVQVSTGGDGQYAGVSCAVRQNGGVACWGSDYTGQLGDLLQKDSSVPVTIPGISDAKSVSVGNFHVCALRATGQVACWGANTYGVLGTGDTNQPDPPVFTIPGLSDVAAIAAGDGHTCAAKTNGDVLCWGMHGSIGDGADLERHTPTPVISFGRAVALSSFSEFNVPTCAATDIQQVYCWGGLNGVLQPELQFGGAAAVALAKGSAHLCVVTPAGGVSCAGDNDSGQIGDQYPTGADPLNNMLPQHSDSLVPVTLPGGANSVSAGYQHACAIFMTSGDVYCWGLNSNGQLGNGTRPVDPPYFQATPAPMVLPSW